MMPLIAGIVGLICVIAFLAIYCSAKHKKLETQMEQMKKNPIHISNSSEKSQKDQLTMTTMGQSVTKVSSENDGDVDKKFVDEQRGQEQSTNELEGEMDLNETLETPGVTPTGVMPSVGDV